MVGLYKHLGKTIFSEIQTCNAAEQIRALEDGGSQDKTLQAVEGMT
jgi:hypothetical protein